MKLLSLLLTAILCAAASAQTIKTLGYNSTNGQVVANTGTNVLTFTNNGIRFNSVTVSEASFTTNGVYSVGISTYQGGERYFRLTVDNQQPVHFRTNETLFQKPINFNSTNGAAANTRANLGLGATWLTNTNVTNFRTAIGLGATNDVVFNQLTVNGNVINGSGFFYAGDFNSGLNIEESWIKDVSTNQVLDWGSANDLSVGRPILFTSTTNAATTRTNLGLPLAALTNTSNVTTMRALSGSTNTNHPYSGSISVTGTNNTNTLVFSNGILQSVQ